MLFSGGGGVLHTFDGISDASRMWLEQVPGRLDVRTQAPEV